MQKLWILILACIFSSSLAAQGRNINRLTLETTYSFTEIHKSLRDMVDAIKKESYFSDAFFNGMLKKVLLDRQFTNKEKVQVFYLMQKKLGYAFVGVNYLPPQQNYFIFHLSKVQVYNQTKTELSSLGLDPSVFIQIADSHRTNDPVISSNALFLAALLDNGKTLKKLHSASRSENILQSKNPAIYNHYLCLSASLVQDSVVLRNLRNNLKTLNQAEMIEDALCALYSQPQPLQPVMNYLTEEKNNTNELAVMTALCILRTKLSETSFTQGIKNLALKTPETWKKDLMVNIADNKIPYAYTLTHEKQVVTKLWKYVQATNYNDGTLISNNTLLEFDSN